MQHFVDFQVLALTSLTHRLVAKLAEKHQGTTRCYFKSNMFLKNWKIRLKLSEYPLLVECYCSMHKLHADIVIILHLSNNSNFKSNFKYDDTYEFNKRLMKNELCSLLKQVFHAISTMFFASILYITQKWYVSLIDTFMIFSSNKIVTM